MGLVALAAVPPTSAPEPGPDEERISCSFEEARDEALAVIDERGLARERSLAARKAASDGVEVDRLEQAETRLGECERRVQVLTNRLQMVENVVATTAETPAEPEAKQRVGADEESSERRAAIRLVEPNRERPEETFSIRADLASSVVEDEAEEERGLSGIADRSRNGASSWTSVRPRLRPCTRSWTSARSNGRLRSSFASDT